MKYFPGNIVFRLLMIVVMLVIAALPAQAVTPEQLGLGLVDVAALDASILIDLKYATDDNFTGKCCTRLSAACCASRSPGVCCRCSVTCGARGWV